MTIGDWLRHATAMLAKAGIVSARLDALLLLGSELNQQKAWLLAHDDEPLTSAQQNDLDTQLTRRTTREPLAYILGIKEFYGHEFIVTPQVLIPRPETEAIIDLLSTLPLAEHATVADIGTGSGALAITLKLEHPALDVIATDINAQTLNVAKRNAKRLQTDVQFRQGNLLEPLDNLVDVIVANLPYVDKAWKRSPETNFEPSLALFAGEHGLALIRELTVAAADYLRKPGYLLLEADPYQHTSIIGIATQTTLKHVRTVGYCLCFQND